MVFFINDTKVKITQDRSTLLNSFDIVLRNVHHVEPDLLKGEALIVDTAENVINEFVDRIEGSPLKKLRSITFLVKDKKHTFKEVKSHFKLVKAAGGIVVKGDKILLIHRLGVWDLPKGKLDKGETITECAEREVEEETGVKVKIRYELCDSYHTYVRNKKRNLKRTYWYVMECLDDSKMAPQEEEKIDDVNWFNQDEVQKVTMSSYESLRRVLRKYYKSKP